MHLRRTRKDDIEQIEKIEKEAFGKYAATSSTFSPLLELFPKGQWVFENKDEIAAYFFTEKHDFNSPLPYNHDPTKTHKRNGAFLYVSMFYVQEKYRKGLGSRMLRKLEEIGREEDCDAIYLILNKDFIS